MTNLFQCVLNNKSDSRDFFRLPNPVESVKCLIFDHRVPLWLEKIYTIRGCKIQSAAAVSRPFGILQWRRTH